MIPTALPKENMAVNRHQRGMTWDNAPGLTFSSHPFGSDSFDFILSVGETTIQFTQLRVQSTGCVELSELQTSCDNRPSALHNHAVDSPSQKRRTITGTTLPIVSSTSSIASDFSSNVLLSSSKDLVVLSIVDVRISRS